MRYPPKAPRTPVVGYFALLPHLLLAETSRVASFFLTLTSVLFQQSMRYHYHLQTIMPFWAQLVVKGGDKKGNEMLRKAWEKIDHRGS